jgi:hypothetical protein
VRRFLVRAQPSFERILLIESGPRESGDKALRFLYGVKRAAQIDLLTCFSTAPDSFDAARGCVYSVHDREVVANRSRFIGKLARNPYTLVAVLCTGSPILQRWKWAIALRTSARLILMNEEANYFTADVWNLETARLMLLKRLSDRATALAGLSGLLSWIFASFTVGYLCLYTGMVHLRRWTRLRKQAAS